MRYKYVLEKNIHILLCCYRLSLSLLLLTMRKPLVEYLCNKK